MLTQQRSVGVCQGLLKKNTLCSEAELTTEARAETNEAQRNLTMPSK